MTDKRQAPEEAQKKSLDNSTVAQLSRLLKALREAGAQGITTIQAREKLDVMMPAARVHELRHTEGFNIQTIWQTSENAQGHKHRNARYVLMPGVYKSDYRKVANG